MPLSEQPLDSMSLASGLKGSAGVDSVWFKYLVKSTRSKTLLLVSVKPLESVLAIVSL